MVHRHHKAFKGFNNKPIDVISLTFFVAFILFLLLVAFFFFRNTDSEQSSVSRLLKSNNLRLGVLGSEQQTENIKKKDSLLLLEELGKQYGWTITVTSFPSIAKMYDSLSNNKIDLVADAVIDHRVPYDVRYSSSYGKTRPRLVYFPEANKEISKREDFSKNQLLLIQNSWQSHFAKNLSYLYKDLKWQEFPDFWTLEDMIYTIESPPGGYLLVTDEELSFYKQAYPKLKTGLAFESVYLAYAFNSNNASLETFISGFINSHQLQKEESKGNNKRFLNSILHPAQMQSFLKNVKTRFPKYADLFVSAGDKYGLDWRLIAAIGYQESLWNEKAVSPTGVKGLMMLTNATAKFLGVKNRVEPEQSVDGGARYILYLKGLLPKRIKEPDRTWLALAAYNIGPAHLEDVRIITQQNNKNPDRWLDVREFLPYIEKPRWYKESKHGYARGWEARKYVDNIRKYYQVLINLGTKHKKASTRDKIAKVDVQHTSEQPETVLPQVISLRY